MPNRNRAQILLDDSRRISMSAFLPCITRKFAEERQIGLDKNIFNGIEQRVNGLDMMKHFIFYKAFSCQQNLEKNKQ
jgi:hypothetical protein